MIIPRIPPGDENFVFVLRVSSERRRDRNRFRDSCAGICGRWTRSPLDHGNAWRERQRKLPDYPASESSEIVCFDAMVRRAFSEQHQFAQFGACAADAE